MSPEPTQIGPYRLDAAIARGGMGEIWRATDIRSDRTVAVKRILVGGQDSDHGLRTRLLREAQALHQLRHEHVVGCLDSGVDDEGQPFIVLEWLEGEDLGRRLSRAPLSLSQTAEVMRQALTGLEYVHGQGVVHRDLKPPNLFLLGDDPPRVKIVDFGLALLGDDATRLTQQGQIMGTLYYLAPEQARGAPDFDHRVDLYTMGVILYRLTTGRLPFVGDQPVAVLLKIVTETPPRPRQIQPNLPSALEELILRAMARAPSDRFGSARQMLEALDWINLTSEAEAISFPAGGVDPMEDTAAAVAPTQPQPSGGFSGEHRLVSLLCVQPVRPGMDLGPLVERAAQPAGGQIQSLLGGQRVVLFGVERSTGEEALSAVRAGLELRDAVGPDARLLAATVHLELRQGVCLTAGELDQAVAGLGIQPPGELILDPSTRKLVGQRVVSKRVGTHEAAVELSRALHVRRTSQLEVEARMVGRDPDLATLRAAFQQVLENQESGAAQIVGVAGMGKTRLKLELAPDLEDRSVVVLEARAEPSRTAIPYGLIGEAIQRAAGLHVGQELESQRATLERFLVSLAPTQEWEETRSFLGEVVGVAFDETPSLRVAREEPRVMRERVTGAFEHLLQTATEQGPVSLCLEDLQWADPESIGLCEALLERLEDKPLFVLATSRPELDEQHPHLFQEVEPVRVDLKPLGRRPMRRLVAALLRDKVSSELEQLILRWSEGNPHFVEELVAWLLEEEAVVLAPEGWQLKGDVAKLSLPVGIQGAIQSRLDRLSADLRELLRAASVFGDSFWEAALVDLGVAEPTPKLAKLESAGFVRRSPSSRFAGTVEWGFRHALTHQVAHGMLVDEDRRGLHRLAARWLEQTGENEPVVLARHFEAAGEADRARTYYARAGTRALAEGNPEQAVEWLWTALADATESQRRERNLTLGQALVLLGRYDEAWIATESANVPGGTDRVAAELGLLRARILRGQRKFGEAGRVIRTTMEQLDERAHPDILFGLLHTLFWVIWVRGQYQDAGQVAARLFSSATRDNQPELLGLAELAMSYYQAVQGDLSQAVELASQAVGHARELGHPYRETDALTLLGSLQELVGLHAEAHASLDAALILTTRLKLRLHQATLTTALSRVLLAQGQTESALEQARLAITLAEEFGDPRILALALTAHGHALIASGSEKNLDRARNATMQALELSRDKLPPVEAEVRRILVLIALARNETAEALDHALIAQKILNELGTHEEYEIQILLGIHDALKAAHRDDEAQEILARTRNTLQEKADRIGDPALRERFLALPHNVRAKQLHQHRGG